MNKVFFSIVIPVYNTEVKYIKRCLWSCLSQDYGRFEIILVNDCSTKKETLKYLKTLKNKKVQVINNKENIGLGPTRNVGIENSKGDYILFVDSDDFIETNTLSSLASINLKSYDLITFNLRYISDNNETEENTKYYYKIGRNKVWGGGTTWTKAYNSKFLKSNKIRFHNSRLYHEDEYFTMQCLRYSPRIKFTDNVFYNYSLGVQNSITNNLEFDRSFNDIAIWIKDIKLNKNDCKILRRWYSSYFSIYFLNYLRKSKHPKKEIFIEKSQLWKANYKGTKFIPSFVKVFYALLLQKMNLQIIFFIWTKLFRRIKNEK